MINNKLKKVRKVKKIYLRLKGNKLLKVASKKILKVKTKVKNFPKVIMLQKVMTIEKEVKKIKILT